MSVVATFFTICPMKGSWVLINQSKLFGFFWIFGIKFETNPSLLKPKNSFSHSCLMSHLTFYAGQICLALKYLHQMPILYRKRVVHFIWNKCSYLTGILSVISDFRRALTVFTVNNLVQEFCLNLKRIDINRIKPI